MAGSSGGMFDGLWTYTKISKDYLNIGYNFYTLTPAGAYYPFDGKWHVLILSVNASGEIDDNYGQCYVRPVINLKANAIKYGTGTSSDPYRVTEN